jgi:oxygen-independent coproporphyrinogen III oxidase
MLLYLHIPFCHRICPYCSFYKHTPGNTAIGDFVEALVMEAGKRLAECGQSPRTLYMGGGTPSMLSPSHLRRLFGGLGELFDISALDEVTFEANPATFDLKKAELFRELGVTRVSLGIQSFTDSVLQVLGREHNAAEAEEAVKILREAGMPEVNVDLMFSIPGQTRAQWQETLERSIATGADHISAYNLTYEEDTAFFESLKRGDVRLDEDRDADFFYLAHDLLTGAGYEHYETSNYAKGGCKSSHNHGYWRGEDYLGLGPSAVSTVAGVRSRNVADTAAYVQRVKAIGHATDEAETLDEKALRLERIALMLRTNEGIEKTMLDASGLARLSESGLLEEKNGRIILTRAGLALVDPIAAELV